MKYWNIESGKWETFEQIKKRMPGVSLKKPLPAPQMKLAGVVLPRYGQAPKCDLATQYPEKAKTPELIEGEWVLGYVIKDKSANKIAIDRERHIAKLHAVIAATRDAHIEKGVMVDGLKMKTNDKSIGRVDAAINALGRMPDGTQIENWKAGNGYHAVNKGQLIQAAAAVFNHMQLCYARARQLEEAVTADPFNEHVLNGDPEESPRTIPLQEGWPGDPLPTIQ